MTMVVHAELADALIARGRAGDLERAVESLRRAAELADDIGLPDPRRRVARAGARASATRSSIRTPACCATTATAGWCSPANRRAVAPDLVGVRYLGTLLTHPGAEIPAVELCGGADVDGGGQEVVDRDTLDAYRRRVAEIDEELAVAGRPSDRRRVRRLGDERAALREELASVLAVVRAVPPVRRLVGAGPYGRAQGDRQGHRRDRRVGRGDRLGAAGDDLHRAVLHLPPGPATTPAVVGRAAS